MQKWTLVKGNNIRNKDKNAFVVFEERKMQNKYNSIHRWRNMFLAVIVPLRDRILVFATNQGDSQVTAMNTIILILHFPLFKYNRSILGSIFDIIPLYNSPFLH